MRGTESCVLKRKRKDVREASMKKRMRRKWRKRKNENHPEKELKRRGSQAKRNR